MEKQIIAFVFLILAFHRSYTVSYDWCEPCICSEKLLSCVHRGLNEIRILSQLPSVIKVSFVGNDITAVRSNDFLNVNNLHVLDLTFNEIRTIETGAFRALSQATKIDISFNKIEHLATDTFDFPNRLENLQMEGNHIKSIEFISGIRNCSLIELNLSFNVITRLESNAFSNCRTIENLQLSDNHIEDLQPQIFEDLNQLRVLNVGGNRIKSFSSTLCLQATNVRRQLSLEKLDLSRNLLEEMPSKAFANCPNLKTLLLSHNEIYLIDENAFIDESASNHTSNYDPRTLECTNTAPSYSTSALTYVDLSNNYLHSSDFTDVFQHVKHLSYLNLNNNNLREFSPSLICLIVVSKVIVGLEENYFSCECGTLYELYVLSKKHNLDLNLTCSFPYHQDHKWDVLEGISCDSSQTRIRYVLMFSCIGLLTILVVVLIFARLYYIRTKAAREINPDL